MLAWTLLAATCAGLASDTRAEDAAKPLAAEQLQPLAWMLGEWVGKTEHGAVLVSSRWSDGGNYILREFLLRSDDGQEIGGTQRIGWDPAKKQIKSWSFDSQGGAGEGIWRNDGKVWTVESTETLADGQVVTAKATYTPVDADSFDWEIACSALSDESPAKQRIEFQRAKGDE
jgi:hypothetical protein